MKQYSNYAAPVEMCSNTDKRRLLFPHLCLLVFAFLYLGIAGHSQAVPTFARQTGQSCVACHAGGQFPELTPYGRIFKLTGYTIGSQGNPFSGMLVSDLTRNRNNVDANYVSPATSSTIASQNNIPIVDFGSVFIAGKLTDNMGGFVQITYSVYDHQDNSGNWRGHLGLDNTDLRYANRFLNSTNDLILGVTVHNSPGVQDVWNSTATWGYPYVSSNGGASAFAGLPITTKLEDGTLASQAAGVGGYAYWNKTVYLELTGYQTATGFWKFLSQGYKLGDQNNPLIYSQGVSPYMRLAFTHEWKDQSLMLGWVGMNTNLYQMSADTGLPQFGPVTHYQDQGVDAQYQYLLDPHTVTAHFRYIRENINDDTNTNSNSNYLNSLYAKVTYIYRNQYGADVAYKSVKGSTDNNAYNTSLSPAGYSYASSALSSPSSTLWTPEIFWLPVQNMRIGLQYNLFTEYLGASTHYDVNSSRNASDNNSAFLYAWFAF